MTQTRYHAIAFRSSDRVRTEINRGFNEQTRAMLRARKVNNIMFCCRCGRCCQCGVSSHPYEINKPA